MGIAENKRSLSEANMSTIAIFIKLLATKMVASNFLGLVSSFFTINILLDNSSSEDSSSKSLADNEKKAISAPEINAEHNNKTNKTKTLIMCPLSITIVKNKLGGSISKIQFLKLRGFITFCRSRITTFTFRA